ncbi:uncharacterized protein LOC135154940 [Lytechinus pictus]|uniref:uncharacterized protein LOC135154940 n=1 Tax=Lytechinus pictus TaxID=7653 RepID=UPI0030B9E70D
MDYKQMVLCGVLAVALMTSVAMTAPLELWEIAALDDLLDEAYAEAIAEMDTGSMSKRSSWNYCRHHVTGKMCKCSSLFGQSTRRYFECEAPPYLNNPWNRITRNW